MEPAAKGIACTNCGFVQTKGSLCASCGVELDIDSAAASRVKEEGQSEEVEQEGQPDPIDPEERLALAGLSQGRPGSLLALILAHYLKRRSGSER